MHNCHAGVASCKKQHGIDCIKVFHNFNASISRCIMHGSRTRAVGFFNNGFIVAEEAVDCRNISILGSLKDCNLGTCGRDWTDTCTHTHTLFHTHYTPLYREPSPRQTHKKNRGHFGLARKRHAPPWTLLPPRFPTFPCPSALLRALLWRSSLLSRGPC